MRKKKKKTENNTRVFMKKGQKKGKNNRRIQKKNEESQANQENQENLQKNLATFSICLIDPVFVFSFSGFPRYCYFSFFSKCFFFFFLFFFFSGLGPSSAGPWFLFFQFVFSPCSFLLSSGCWAFSRRPSTASIGPHPRLLICLPLKRSESPMELKGERNFSLVQHKLSATLYF